MSNKSGALKISLLLVCSIIFANSAAAKTWFLPEYMRKLPNTYRSRVNDANTPTVAASECSKFKDSAGNPLLSPSEIPSGQTCSNYPNAVINKNCVGNCKCDASKFIYNSTNCTGNFKLGGSLCTDTLQRGTQCLCKTDTYPYVINGSSCKFPDTAQGVCNDKPSGTAHYKACYADTCWKYSNLVDSGSASCKWGCPSYVDANCRKCNASSCYTDDCHLYNHPLASSCKYGCKTASSTLCTTKCAECYADNCRNRSDNKTEYGCQKYWADCSSKCETGKTCSKRDCAAEGYIQTSCPENANCGPACEPGCGDSTKYYKYGTCNTGFIDLETYWCNGAVKCWWNGDFGPDTVSCSDQGYDRHCDGTAISCNCEPGKTKSVCPDDSSYFKCTGEAIVLSCADLGYDKHCDGSSLCVTCKVGQTIEYCPSDNSYFKCTGTATIDTCDGYSACSSLPCLGTKVTCLTDSTKCICDDSCKDGTFLSSDTAACRKCLYGIVPSGIGKCFRCGSVDECGSNSISKCMQCAAFDERP